MVNPLILIVPLVFSTVVGELKVHYEWKYIDYVWQNPSQKQDAIDNGNYNLTQIFTIDVDQAEDGRIFVTTPRQTGVPATLSTISNKYGEGGPLLKPYPNWSWNTAKDCNGITSVYRVTIDYCNRLWVLDTGKNGNDQVCPAQLLAFDLLTDRLVRRVTIPPEYATNGNGTGHLITPIVEIRQGNCDWPTIYMADVEGYGLVVWNRRGLRRFNDPSFDADQDNADFTISGESFHLPDGLFTLALQPKRQEIYSTRLFYRPLASRKQYYVSTKYFEGDFYFPTTPNFKTINYAYSGQVSMEAFAPDGILFLAYTNIPAIACWNSYKPMNNENVVIVARDEETLQFTSGLKIKGKKLWATTNRFQKIITVTQDFNEINYRILYESDVRNLVKGTNCQ